MKKLLLIFIVLFGFLNINLAQSNLVLNGAYFKLISGTSSSPIYFVVDNSSANAITNLLPCGTPCSGSGGIITESEFNIIQWRQALVPTNYLLPFSKSNTSYIPFTFALSTPAVPASTYLRFSTAPVSDLNLPMPSDVANLTLSTGDAHQMVDRFWHVGDDGASTRPEGSLIFTYLDAEYLAPNMLSEPQIGAVRFNTSLNAWTDMAAIGNPAGLNTATKTLSTPLVNSSDLFRTWTLTSDLIVINTVTAPSSTPTLCANSLLPAITHTTTGATGIANDGVSGANGLPAGVSATWSANTITISGTPTVSGTFIYSILLTGGTGTVNATGTITVSADNTFALSSTVGTDAQTVCGSTAITAITYATTGATGVTFAGLPAGVSGSFASNTVTISGTPTEAGSFPYTVTLTGGCGTGSASGTLTVTAINTIALSSVVGTDAQTVCASTAITDITYTTTGATGATFTGLPTGVSGSFASNTVTISGTPTTAGSFPYTVTLSGGCGTVTATGTLTVTAVNTIALSSSVGTDAQTVCASTAITDITYTTTGATGATFTGLPAGVSGSFASNTVTISGTPSVAGSYPYTVTLTGGCGTVTASGTITVTAVNTIALSSAVGTDAQSMCTSSAITAITYTTTGATGATFAGLPAGVSGSFSSNTVTISGTPSVAGSYPYTVTLTGGCGTVTASGTITVTAVNTIALSSAVGTDAQTVCTSTAITDITYAATGATGATFAGLPAGVTGSFASNTVTISGTPSVAGSFPYTVTLTGGCGTVTATGIITVTDVSTITLSSALGTDTQSICYSSEITDITYTTTGATGATFAGLPTGVSGIFASNTATISGTPTTAGSFPYTVTLTGGCGTVTSTGTITVNALPVLVVDPTEATLTLGESVQLNVTGANTYSWLTTDGLSCDNCANPFASPTSNTTYCVEGTSLQGCVDTVCVEVTVELDCGEPYIPTGFSPNNDGKNDVFRVRIHNECVTGFNLLIYDRLGELIFESDDVQTSWDGTYKGKLLNDAVFVYVLSITLLDSTEPVIKKGNITLIK